MKRLGNLLIRSLDHTHQWATQKDVEVPVRECVHFCGFRYGRQEYNPYETYLIDLHRGLHLRVVRRRFIDFLRHYRPRHMGEALGVSFSQRYGLWIYPWDNYDPREWRKYGWRNTPGECPDILTHFCELGIPSIRIDEEFVWLEKTLYSIANLGYQPEKHGPARVLEFRRADHTSAYLILDGNHRASALAALGCRETIVARCERIVQEEKVDTWPAVQNGWMKREDALALFHAYFRGNPSWTPSETPARIIAPHGWEQFYFS
ncbi:MAG TPA: hypothetical protein VJ464_02190 [Blastocatellia bacterium]|nr:hypothetical protein [Blastocatellia bacterium]